MKRALKWTGIILLTLIGVIFLIGWVMNEPLPEGETGPEADALAERMMDAVNKQAWDTTRFVTWTFNSAILDPHNFVWDKTNNVVQVTWQDYQVVVINDLVEGEAYQNGVLISDPELHDNLVKKAWAFFCNDSFWLNAVVKAFDPGVERRLIKQEEGNDALLVTYSSGGVTPGDSYLWILDDDGRPNAWQMWVKVLPIGGIKTSWQDYKELPGGALVAQNHFNGERGVKIQDLNAAQDLQDLAVDATLLANLTTTAFPQQVTQEASDSTSLQ